MKITSSNKKIEQVAKKYTKLVLKSDKSPARFIAQKDGTKELQIGVGKFSEISPRKFITLVRHLTQSTKTQQIECLAINLENINFTQLSKKGEEWLISTLAENLLLAEYEFTRYKTKKQTKKAIKEVLICGKQNSKTKQALKRGQIVGTYSNKARDIANTTGADLTPDELASEAKRLAKGKGVTVKSYNEKEIVKKGLHALWAVGKGADDMPRFIVMEYKGGKAGEKPIVLIGKGITYDTGGLNVKPSGSMHDMHMDMSGGSTVIASIVAAAELKIKKNVVALIPAAENSVSAKAMRAGDIINSHSGKTIEVLHTDAEGRLVLADALSYSKKYNPKVIIDAATLTGASMVALGTHASALLTSDEKLQRILIDLGEESGDYVWPLPLWDEYKTPLTHTRADVVNIHPQFSRNSGCIEGAAFLSFFAPKNVPWAHLDIAPRMDTTPHDKLAKGSTGEPVRLLIKFIEQY